jgi:hypothetical protein
MLARMLVCLLFALASMGCSNSNTAAPTPQATAGSADPSAIGAADTSASTSTSKIPEGPPVATLLGKPVYRRDCLSASSGIGSAEVGIVILVLAELSKEICDPKSLTLSQEEIDEFWKKLRAASSKGGYTPRETPDFDEKQVQQQLDDIRGKLAAADLSRLERNVLEGQQHAAQRALEVKSVPGSVAYSELIPLRCQDAVYKKYGGKVVARQISMEPAEAYFKLAKEAEQNGKLVFHDDALKQAFWQRLNDDMNHPEVPADQIDFTVPAILKTP